MLKSSVVVIVFIKIQLVDLDFHYNEDYKMQYTDVSLFLQAIQPFFFSRKQYNRGHFSIENR